MPVNKPVLITDFDGTITEKDFFQLVIEKLLSPADLAPWEAFRAGKISHFTALKTIFGKIRAPENTVLALLDEMRPDPLLPRYVAALQDAGWHIVVASAGCEWYIRRILDRMEVNDLEVHSNPGRYHKGGPLELFEPTASPFHCPETGIDKAAITRFYLDKAGGAPVVYMGDGVTDAPAGLLLPPDCRFARADMAMALREAKREFRPFEVWSDVPKALLEKR